jgi:hypothetical protein
MDYTRRASRNEKSARQEGSDSHAFGVPIIAREIDPAKSRPREPRLPAPGRELVRIECGHGEPSYLLAQGLALDS